MTEINENCTCNDEFRTKLCPVHQESELNQGYETKETIIDDTMLVNPKPVHFLGNKLFMFQCPACNQPSILHHFNGCPNCLIPVKIQSKIVTDFIKGLI